MEFSLNKTFELLGGSDARLYVYTSENNVVNYSMIKDPNVFM